MFIKSQQGASTVKHNLHATFEQNQDPARKLSTDYNSKSGPSRSDERGVKGVRVLAMVGTTMPKRVL